MPANRKNLLLAAGLFLLAGALHEAEILLPPALRSPCFLAVTLLYLGLSLGWAASIAQRIMHRAVRRLLIACAALAALWIVLRTCKYRFFDSEAVCLMLWYFYYLPQLFAPVLMLLAALHLGRREEEAVSPRWYLLLVPAAALFLGIATNNRHELAFRFFPPQSRPDVYAHGPLYFTAVAFMLVMMAAGVGVVFARSRVPCGRRFIWLPGAVFLAGFALCLLSFANVLTAFKVPEMFCATFIATWECCMQVGLLPSNTNYGGFFSASTICAQLDDAQGNVVLCSAQPLSLTAAQRRQAREGALMLTPDLRLGAHAIRGGAILYAESIAGINRIRDQLQETAGLLAEENELVRAENEAAAQQARIEEQNRLYEGMLGALVEAARAVGVAVTAEGPQPAADSPAAALLLHAAHECLTNTVRHAGGTALHISLSREGGRLVAVLTNDGRAPDGPVREGGGLSALRRQVEASGGRMRIESAPRFALILELDGQEA